MGGEVEARMGWSEVAATLLWRICDPVEDDTAGHIYFVFNEDRWDLLEALSSLLDRVERLERLVGSGE